MDESAAHRTIVGVMGRIGRG